MTYKKLTSALLAATIALCGSAIAQQVEFSGDSVHGLAPAFSPQQLRESLTQFARNHQLAKEDARGTSPVGENISSELVFRPLPKVVPVSRPMKKAASDSINVFRSSSALPMADAFPELPGISILAEQEESLRSNQSPVKESISMAQPGSIEVSYPSNQESIEVPEAALSVPAGLRVPEELMELPVIEFGEASSGGETRSAVLAPQGDSIVTESLSLPQGIHLPLAEAMTGDSVAPVQLTPAHQQASISATDLAPPVDHAPASLPVIQDTSGSLVQGSLEPGSFDSPAMRSRTFVDETFTRVSPAIASPQTLVESPGVYGFQCPAPAPVASSLSVTDPVFDPSSPPQNPVPQNAYPIQYAEPGLAQVNSNAWQAPATPTPGHNERNRITPELSLAPPPITGRPLTEYLPVQPPAFEATDYPPKFDRQVGHRGEQPIRRFDSYSLNDGEKFSYETKKRDFPPFGEIIATGRFFYMAEVLWAEPQFQANTLIATQSAGFGESIAGDFDSDFHPRFRFGFESPYGPGVELTYFNINSNSELASFTSDGIASAQTSASVVGLDGFSRVVADDLGEQLVAQHSLDIDSFTVSFFKELKFPISRVNGNFGFQYVSIAHELNADVSVGGAPVETLRTVTDMRAFGPRAILEYYRPIGHTPLELVTTFGGSVLFGQRDQFVTNSQTGALNRVGADEFLTILDFFVGAQYIQNVGENRAWYGRFGFMNQTWLGGGSASFPQGDLGLRGFTFGIGYNR